MRRISGETGQARSARVSMSDVEELRFDSSAVAAWRSHAYSEL
jgi:hypothetical protein